MAVTEKTVSLTPETLERVQAELRSHDLDGWLLYDFRGNNPVTAGLLGLPALTRRVFVFIPAQGTPRALTHRIEQQPWRGWIGENTPYLSWESLHEGVKKLVGTARRVAIEYSENDSVPYLDRLPAGVIDLVRTTGVDLVSSGDLVSAFHSRWTEQGYQSHVRAARVLRDAAFCAFAEVGARLRSGGTITEWAIRQWILDRLRAGGLEVGADSVVAVNGNAANPHYAPSSKEHAPIRRGDVLLIDLWGKETEESVYADQTWMAYVGAEVPGRVQTLWEAIRDGRDAAIELIRSRWEAEADVSGYEADRAARAVIGNRGFGDAFIHRTGHSIDQELHGSGPNLDDLETRDNRTLIQGVGFSVEPGIYLAGEVGLRTEVDVYMGENGPEVTTPEPQSEMERIVV